MKPSGRSVWVVVSTILFCAFLGALYGRQVEATASGDNNTGVRTSLKEFTAVYGVVEQNYADPVKPDRAIYGPTDGNVGAIPGMLHTLDPHSNFFDPTAFAKLRETQEGKYYGVGMTIQTRPGPMGMLETFVVSPMPGSPAFRAGLHAGDVILKVDGKQTNGPNAPRDPLGRTNFVANMLLGPKNTIVHVTVYREGMKQPLEFTITRGEIPKVSVDAAFLLKPGIGYIHLNGFTDTTNDELTKALHKFNQDDLRGLILDLRHNPGGLLEQAVEVADHFLEKGQLIVYHYGRSSRPKRYYAVHGDNHHEYAMVVLIDHLTASAAEIVAGALQDHDRALIIGERSFGKGLVQTVFPLSDNTGLALTTAHYYTPSGRLIQRPYNNISLYDYYNAPASNAPSPHSEVRFTDGGREVYGGGGITPDVQASQPNLTPPQMVLEGRAAFFNYAEHYASLHPSLPENFQVDDATLQDFRKYLAQHQIQISDKDFNASLDFIKDRLRERVVQMYSADRADQLIVEDDPVVQKALASLDQARELMAHAKKYMAARARKAEQP